MLLSTNIVLGVLRVHPVGCCTSLQRCRPAAAAGRTVRARWHIRSILLWFVTYIAACNASRRMDRWSLGCGPIYASRLPTIPTTTTNNNCHQKNYSPSLLLPSSSNRQNQSVRWHIHGVLLAAVPVGASVGAYDASSRIGRQSLRCGRMYACMYVCMYVCMYKRFA